MDKSNIVNLFTSHIEQLRTTECSQKEKITCFQQIAECIMSPPLMGHINYTNHCSTAVNVLLLFCEDLDSVVRMSAEENLNKIFRSLEKTRVSRILMDLYGEIKRNGNQRSLRICLNLFSYYAPRIKEKNLKGYAVRLLACMQIIAQRKETQLSETLCEFVKCFSRYLQVGLTDSETCKLFEVFIENIGAECAVKRRCSSQNCISLIENSRNKSLMAKHGLNQVIDLLLSDQETHTVLGCLGFLRLLLPLIIRGFPDDCPDDGDGHSNVTSSATQRTSLLLPTECRQIVEIYDYCLHLLNISNATSSHGLINAALEVINAVLQSLDGAAATDYTVAKTLHEMLLGSNRRMQQQRHELLRRRKSLKNQIFRIGDENDESPRRRNSNNEIEHEQADEERAPHKLGMQKTRVNQMEGTMGIHGATVSSCTDEDGKQSTRTSTTTSAVLYHHHGHIRHATARSISECVDDENLLATVVGSVEDESETEAKASAANDDDDDGDGDGNGAGELEVDDFITFSEINEPQQTMSVATAPVASTPPPTSIDVDNLLDAMLHDDGEGGGNDGTTTHQLYDSNLLGTSTADDKSQHLSDIDNESFNSIDFEAEITIGGRGQEADAITEPATDTTNPVGKTTNNDTIGTFFNNLLTHSNAATESVSKLFRPSSGAKNTPTKSPAHPQPDKLDTVSTATSLSAGDSLSFTSTASSNRRLDSDISEDPLPEVLARKRSDVSSNASTFSRSASVTASTAVLADTNTRDTATAAECSSDEEEGGVLLRDKSGKEADLKIRVPNVNPFLKENSPLKQSQPGAPLLTLKIGTIYEQPLVVYTARLTAARFLLTGQIEGLHLDSVIRVSIKSLSLMVIAQCVRLEPAVLQLPLEISEEELKRLQEAELPEKVVDSSSPKHSSSGDSSSNLSRDYEHLEAHPSDVPDIGKKSPLTPLFPSSVVPDDSLLLEIKDDHFGPSSCDYKTLLNDPLSRSADPIMLGILNYPSVVSKTRALSKSEIVSPTSTREKSYRITEASEDSPPLMQPPRPPKRTKSLRKSLTGAVTPTPKTIATTSHERCKDAPQPLADILLFYKHTDPILRGGVQLIIGNFVESSGAGLALAMSLDLQRLLAILLKGFEDDIHTVVIQALNAFDKMFPHVIAKYLTEPACHYPYPQQQQQQQQETCKETLRKQQVIAVGPSTSAQSFANDVKSPRPSTAFACCIPTDNDELLDDLLKSHPQMRLPNDGPHSTTMKSGNCDGNGDGASFFISPKLLLDKLRLCRHNKYWLVQNKYAEVISNLNYIPLGHYYEDSDGDDIVCSYEHLFLDELLQLIGDDDFRVREHAAICLCRFIIIRAQQLMDSTTTDGIDQHAATTTNALATYQTNLTLLWDFLDYRLFSGMSMHLRQLFCTNGTAPSMDVHSIGSASSVGVGIAGFTNTITPTSLLPSTMGGSGLSTVAMAFDGGFQHANFSAIRGDCQRHTGNEEKLLSKVLYRLANKLMALHDKNLQFGVIYTLKLLLRHFNWIDYQQAWREFNFIEISMKFTYHNFGTASDLNCQNDLIDVTAKLMAGRILSTGNPSALMQSDLEQLMQHTLKIINIYYHLFTNQRPLFIAKTQKPDLFINAKELAIMQCMGYFGNDYVYIKLYNILRSANDSYKITINQEAGSLLLGLMRTCLNTLSVCIELHAHRQTSMPAAQSPPTPLLGGSPSTSGGGSPLDGNFPSNAVLKLIEEILQYLGKLINYAPGECIGCLKQLLKYLFAQNYGNRHQDYYATFIRPYFVARHKGNSNGSWQKPFRANTINFSGAVPPQGTAAAQATTPGKLVSTPPTPTTTKTTTMTSSNQSSHRDHQRNSIVSFESYEDGRPRGGVDDGGADSTDDYRLFGELLVSGLQFHTWKSERESECGRHIKLFEPLVIYCMQLFLKMNACVQAPILELLSQLLDLNVTYSILDSKNVIFDQIMSNLELIESGNVRNAHLIIPPMMKFLMQLTQKSDRKLITIPKLISVANNLLANSAIRDCAVLSLKSLVYELFFALPMSPVVGSSSVTVGDTIERRAHFQSPITVSPASTPGVYQHHKGGSTGGVRSLPAIPLEDTVPGAAATAAEDLLAQQRELDTQKEVVLGMLEKFIDTGVCQQVLGLLMLRERCNQQMDEAIDDDSPTDCATNESRQLTMAASTSDTQPQVYSLICRSICEGRYRVDDWRGFYALDTFFRNNGRNVLADSKEFLALLQLLITKDVTNFCDLSYATIILANVILKTEEIYLVNHIKLYLRNHSPPTMAETPTATSSNRLTEYWLNDGPSTSTAAKAAAAAAATGASSGAFTSSCPISEINYFGKVLVEKLLTCLDTLIGLAQRQPHRPSRPLSLYCGLTQLFVRSVHDCCCRSRHKDALQSVFRLMLAESEFLDKYYNLIMMHGTPICCWPLAAADAAPVTSNEAASVGGNGTVLGLQVEVFKLLSAMKMVTTLTFLLPKPVQQQRTLAYLERRMLSEILRIHGNPINWKLQQVQQLFDARFVNILIMEHFEYVCNLCKVDEQFYALWLDGLRQSIAARSQPLPKPAVRLLLRQFGRLCSHFDYNGQTLLKCLQVLSHLHHLVEKEEAASSQRLQMERLARRLSSQVSNEEEQQRLSGLIRESLMGDGQRHHNNHLMVMILSDLNNLNAAQTAQMTSSQVPKDTQTQTTTPEARIIDEKWLFGQVIKFSTQSHLTDLQQLSRILLEIQSENKLHKIFENASFDGARVLRHAIVSSLEAMLVSFRNNCVQHNPHIHYLQPNPLARVTCAILMARLTDALNATVGRDNDPDTTPPPWPMQRLAVSVIALIECVERIERAALIYIDARFVERFLREQLLRPDMVATLSRFLALCCRRLDTLITFGPCGVSTRGEEFHALLRCIEVLLHQKFIWHELNCEVGASAVSALVLLMGRLAKQTLNNTIFYRKFKGCIKNAAEDYAVFIAKLIETQIDISTALGPSAIASNHLTDIDCGLLEGSTADNELMERIISIGISVLRTNQFYAYAVTPYEIVQQQPRDRLVAGTVYESPTKRPTAAGNGKLPTIPVDSLSDADILRKFVKRLSIFGFTTRQQFEEYFMTFLLLINKVYDEHMVDQQEQYQIKSTCLEAILELLITYKTFPIVGSSNKLSQFHHTTRWARINCDGICLKKLHKVQLLISDMNLFYHPNLERQLTAPSDNVIGTQRFDLNQYDLNFVWQQMEAYAQISPSVGEASDKRLTTQVSSESGDDNKLGSVKETAIRNYRYFAQQSGVDFKSSSQLIFDVLMQIMEYNHILALPNLVKFCEICESRDQIKSIKDKALRLQEAIPMDDTISHQHLIYLLCKTQAMLIPTLGQLQHLCSLIGTYLKSSHVFIRNATLAGLLCLLESSSKTNTTIGKLSDELSLLRDLIVGYINRHGIIKESSMQCCDTHTKLVWTLNYCLIEWTSKFVPQCNLLANTIIAASNFLKKTTNEDLFLCVLHGLERVVVVTITPNGGGGGNNGMMSNVWRTKIEKLALDLLKLENEKFSIPALKLLLSCMYVGSAKQLENTELSNGIVQDDPEIIAQQTDKVDVLLHCIKSSTREAAWIYGQVLCQIIRDLVPPKEILTKVIKEFVAVNQPHCDVIAMVVHQVFRSAIDSSDLQMLQDWLICTLPTFLGLPERKAVWGLSVIFLSASINLHLIKLFPVVLGSGTGTGQPTHTTASYSSGSRAPPTTTPSLQAPASATASHQPHKLGQHEIALFVTAAQDFHIKLSSAQRMRFQEAFKKFQQNEIYARLLHSLH